jgi:ABC-2 type transport system ATP-binding protein
MGAGRKRSAMRALVYTATLRKVNTSKMGKAAEHREWDWPALPHHRPGTVEFTIGHETIRSDDQPMNAISCHGLTKDYGRHRGVFDLDLEVHEGEAFGFIGPNGAGKTTTVRLLMDLIRPDRGSADIMGMDTQREGVKIRRVTGFLPGEPPDYPNHTGESILDLDLRRRYRDYSHGNKQKVWLIQAFMHDPRLLFLDEPTSGLDPLMQQGFRDLVEEARGRGATIFLSSHVLPEVQEICDRIGVIHDGTLRQVGTMAELRLGNVRRVDATVERPIAREQFTCVPGVEDVVVSDHRLRCTITGRMEPLLDALRPAVVLTLDSTEMSLEEVFLSQYGQSARS